MRNPKKSQRNKIMLAASLLVISMLLSGCGIDWRNYIYTEESLKDVAEKSLEEKYGEEFVVHNAWDKSQEMFFAECSPKDDLEIVFKAHINKNGDGVVDDGYTEGVIAKELDNILEEEFETIFEGCYTKAMPPSYYNVHKFDEPRKVSLKDYMEIVGFDFVGMGYYVFIPLSSVTNDTIKQEYEYFSGELQRKVEMGEIPDVVVSMYFVDEQMLHNAQDYFSVHTTYDSTFGDKMDKYQLAYFAYPEEKINKTYDEYKEMRIINE